MIDFFSVIAELVASFIGPSGGKGTVLPEEFRPKDQPVEDKQNT